MKKNIYVVNTNYSNEISVNLAPVVCPYCHQEQIPTVYAAIQPKESYSNYFIFCECTNKDCLMAYNIMYNTHSDRFLEIIQGKRMRRSFTEITLLLSPSFCEIYNEAYAAEQINLSQITGVGYRKALEFLIKDYLISKSPNEAEAIKAKMLGKCIEKDIKDEKIKSVAKRATWLGNDETHYVRKWETMDITHLKKLINLCLHHIESEIETEKMLAEMPDGK